MTMRTDVIQQKAISAALRAMSAWAVLVLVFLLAPNPAYGQDECPTGYPVDCGEYCCADGYVCGGGQCGDCIPASRGDECPAGSCAWCPATHPQCVGWPGTNHTCCTRDATTCNVGSDVWCCSSDDRCGSIKGQCL